MQPCWQGRRCGVLQVAIATDGLGQHHRFNGPILFEVLFRWGGAFEARHIVFFHCNIERQLGRIAFFVGRGIREFRPVQCNGRDA